MLDDDDVRVDATLRLDDIQPLPDVGDVVLRQQCIQCCPCNGNESLDAPQGIAPDVRGMDPCLEMDWALLFLHRSAIFPGPLP